MRMPYIRCFFLTILFLLAASLVLVPKIYADGVQLSTTQFGSTATFNAQIPADPCGTHKLGETKNRTVVGFAIATTPFNMGDDNVMRIVNEKRADLTDAIISDFTISGRKISDFVSNPVDYSSLNWQDFIHYHRTFNLNTPIEFTPQDSASIVVSNVIIMNKGTIKPEFALLEPNGQFCLNAKYTVITLGASKPTNVPNNTVKLNPSPSVILKTPTLIISVSPTVAHIEKKTKAKENSVIEKKVSPVLLILEFIKKIFGVNSK